MENNGTLHSNSAVTENFQSVTENASVLAMTTILQHCCGVSVILRLLYSVTAYIPAIVNVVKTYFTSVYLFD